MVGLDAAGKTTVLHRLKLGETISTIPTIGFNVEEITYKNLNFTIWDMGGQDSIRMLWRHYCDHNDAIIFVIDATDQERMLIAKEELWRLLSNEELANCDLLVYANKQDLPDAMNRKQIAKEMELEKIRDRKWCVMPSVAVTGDGLYEGLNWVADVILKKPKSKRAYYGGR